MTKIYKESTFSAAIFASMLILFFGVSMPIAKAQTFYRSVSATQINMSAISSNIQSKEIKSEGSFLIKDGSLDEIYNLKLILPTVRLDSLIGSKKITFEQTRVMVLPIMGMVHVIGTLDVEGSKSTTSLQLGFVVNNDQSVTFKGAKMLKLSDLVKDFPGDELNFDINFVLRNDKNNLVTLTAK